MKFSLFGDKQFYKSLFTLAVPIMLQNLINSFVNMVDTVMIGRLGTEEIAAVGLGNNVFFLFNMILFGICSGGAIFTAQFWGRRDVDGIRKNTGVCLILTLFVSAVFTVLVLTVPDKILGIYSRDSEVVRIGAEYLEILAPSFIPFAVSFVFTLTLRSVEKVNLAMISTLIALSINMVLNYLLIFGIGPFPVLEVRGAAIATVIARITEMFILVIVSYKRKYVLAGRLREFLSFNKVFFARFLRIASPVMFNEFIWSLGISMQNIIFARTGTDAIAAFNITNTVSQLTWVVFIGLGNGVAVLIGKKIGEGNEEAARSYAMRIAVFSPLMAAAVAALLYPMSFLLPYIFNVNAAVLEMLPVMFIILCASYPLRSFSMAIIVGICRAGGDTIFCVLLEMLSMWAYSLPFAAFMAFVVKAGVPLIYLCLCSEDIVKFIIGLWRLRSGKWLNNVIN